MNRRKFFQDSLIGVAGLSALADPLRGWGGFPDNAGGDSSSNLKPYWPARGSRLFHDALAEGAGFSFTYGGRKAFLASSEGWDIRTQRTADSLETSFHHDSGLTVFRKMRAYPQFDALDYTVTFKNEGTSTLLVPFP